MSLTVKRSRMAVVGRGGAPGRPMGDPGLFGFLGGVAKKIATNFPGPIGFGSRALSSVFGSKRVTRGPVINPPPLLQLPMGTTRSMPGLGTLPMPVMPTPGFKGAIQRLLPGGQTGFQVTAPGCPEGMAMKGYRLNKSDYFLKDGTYIPEGTRMVKIRRRNPLNPRALDRAMSRITSAKGAASKLGRITIRKKTCPA